MEIIYHKRISHDLQAALSHYESEGGVTLANRFYDEVEEAVRSIIKNPKGYHFSDGGLRRFQFRRFPYNILYEVDGSFIWVAVIRHDSRHPSFGLRRSKNG